MLGILIQNIFNTSIPLISLSLYCKQMNRVENKIDGKPSSPLSCKQVSDCKAAFTPMHLMLLKLDIHNCHFDFKFYDENDDVVSDPKKDSVYNY